MTTEIIFLYAIGVFALMFTGIILTMVEFNKLTEEPSKRKGAGSGKPSAQTPPPRTSREDIRLVHRNDDAA